MSNIIDKTKKLLKSQGRSSSEINMAIGWLQETCVACKHSKECRAKGITTSPYQKKCERHELVDRFANI